MPVLIVSEKDFTPRRLLDETRDVPIFIGDDDAEFERIRHPLQRDGRGGATTARDRQ